MKTKILCLATILAAATVASQGSAATQLITNGGFEDQTFVMGTQGYYNIGPSGADNLVPDGFGWTVSTNNVDIISYQSYGPAPVKGGSYGLDLVGYGSTGEISQTINTVAGKTYNVTLDYKSNPGVVSPTAQILVAGPTGPVTIVGNVTGGSSWKEYWGEFTATSSSTSFAVNETYGYSNGGVFLDNVSVSAVPELSTWVMMLLGFASLGFAGYRRTKTNSVSLLDA